MRETPKSKTIPLKTKSKRSVKSETEKMKDLVADSIPKKKPRKDIQNRTVAEQQMTTNTRTAEHIVTIYELNLTLLVTKKQQAMTTPMMSTTKRLPRTVTLEQVVDVVKNQSFKAGTVNIILKSTNNMEPTEEIVQGVDAEDVELILQLFGVVE